MSITQLAKQLKKRRETVWSWIKNGLQVGSHVVRLPAQKIGAQWVIYREQYEMFVKACNPGRQALPESPLRAQQRRERGRLAVLKKLGG